MSKIVANILCHNDLPYIQNLIPQVKKMVDHIIVVDDLSTDGTREFLKMSGVEIVERKFDLNFSNQRNAALELVENGDWVFRIDSDEIPTANLISNLKQIIRRFEAIGCDRVTIPIFHLVNMVMCKIEMGAELRLFKKYDSSVYIKNFHEVIHAEFPKDTKQLTLPEWLALVHLKYADTEKIAYTKDFFINNKLYDTEDLNRRLDMETTFLPHFVQFNISESLKRRICTMNS